MEGFLKLGYSLIIQIRLDHFSVDTYRFGDFKKSPTHRPNCMISPYKDRVGIGFDVSWVHLGEFNTCFCCQTCAI